MKKRTYTTLALKKSIVAQNLTGGISGKPNSALPDPKTVHRKLCYLQDNTALHCPSS